MSTATPPPAPPTEWDGHVDSVAHLADRLTRLQPLDADGQPLTSAGVLNLVAVARSEDANEVEAGIEALRDHQPSRAIVVERAAGGEGIDAHIEARAQVFGGAKRPSRVELVRLTLHGRSMDGAASAVRSLLRPDLPVFVWWPGPPDMHDAMLPQIIKRADRLITESSRCDDPVVAVDQLIETAGAGPALTDLAWAQLTPWRQLVNQVVDVEHVEKLRQGGVAEIWFTGERPTVEAYLLAGWLRDTLGERLHVELMPRRGQTDGGIAAMRLESLAGRQLTLERYPDRSTAAVVVSSPFERPRRRVMPLPFPDRTTLLAGELEYQRRDLPFERALPLAREVANR
ncbi:MAG: glucose-6-phosphate dehydrogenase assembly protein OpcA [Thermoleophilia bacterium]